MNLLVEKQFCKQSYFTKFILIIPEAAVVTEREMPCATHHFTTCCVRRRRTLSNHVVSSRGIDHVPRVSIAMPVDFRVWTPSWTGTLSLDSIWTGTRSLDSMCDHCLLKNHTISLAFKTFSYTE